MRIGIIGGGGAGLTAAWLLEQHHDVTLFEADERLGGHAHTVDVEAHGQRFGVDAGFQFFGPGSTYATFNRLLAALQVPVRTYPATMTLHRMPDGAQVALPPWRGGRIVWPSVTPSAIHDLVCFRRLLSGIPDFLGRRDTTVTTEEYIASQRLPARFVDRFLYPLLLALWCVEPQQLKGFAAYNTLFYLGESLADGFHPPKQLEIEGGMRTYVDALARSLTRAAIRTRARVDAVTRDGEAFTIRDSTGSTFEVDRLVIATGARQALALVEPLDGLDDVAAQLRRFRYFDTTIAVHGDRRLMPPSESAWSVVNARWDGRHSQLSIWNPERGLPVFRSWVTYEERMPEPLYATAGYEHLLVTTEHFDAQARLHRLQGRAGVWLAGLYTDDADSHESAVHSAVTIARELAPDSPRLRLLTG
ncbi:FAD-dependent oxidoreductase [Microbacterium sp. NPDC019599]|uniref:FAD-dependent oxidoreductase n=1 Tax=Microbacterium sp. NPDC019599 TaxID=3154690 RepID=UPI0033C49B2E